MADDSLQFESTRTSTSVGGGGFVTAIGTKAGDRHEGGPHGLPYTHERTLREGRHNGIHVWDHMWDLDVGSDGKQ